MTITVWSHFSQILTLSGVHKKSGRYLKPDDLGIISDGTIVFDESKILWVGETSKLESKYKHIAAKNFSGHTLAPELVDSHTHLVFSGNRAHEYASRLNGVDYQAIAEQGGGILFTVKETTLLRRSELFEIAKKRVEDIFLLGVGTIEIKSGYGLSLDKERELTLVIDDLKKYFKPRVQILNTFMAAHAIPKNFKSGQEYLNNVVFPLLDEFSNMNIIDFIDIFHEQGYFTTSEVESFFDYGVKNGYHLKIHADEFNDNQGASLAAKYSAISADHLLKTSPNSAEKLAQSKCVGTLLPGTGFFLGKPCADARMLLDKGVQIAIASDYNPGSCHCDNLLLIASISAPSLKLNLAELWASITYNAAAALNLTNQGALIANFASRFTIFKCQDIQEITYNWGKNLVLRID